MLRDLLLVLNMLVCIALIGVVLLQRSEGGAFGTGGSPTGLVTARGAGDLLTRTTWVLFTLFLVFSLGLTLLGGRERSSQAILERLKGASVNPDLINKAPPAPAPTTPLPTAPDQSAPPTLTLPPIAPAQPSTTPAPAKPRATHITHRAPAAETPPTNAPANPPAPKLATPAPLALPPITAPTNDKPPS